MTATTGRRGFLASIDREYIMSVRRAAAEELGYEHHLVVRLHRRRHSSARASGHLGAPRSRAPIRPSPRLDERTPAPRASTAARDSYRSFSLHARDLPRRTANPEHAEEVEVSRLSDTRDATQRRCPPSLPAPPRAVTHRSVSTERETVPFPVPRPRKRRCRAKAPRNHNPRVGGSSPFSGIRPGRPNPRCRAKGARNRRQGSRP